MKLITSIDVQRTDHEEVIDSTATKIGLMANKIFLFIINKEMQGWKNLMVLLSWGFSEMKKHYGPISVDVTESAIAIFKKGCQRETAFVQGQFKTQIIDRIDAHWGLHNRAMAWFNAQTQAFLNDQPLELPCIIKPILEGSSQPESSVPSEEPSPDISDAPVQDLPVEEMQELGSDDGPVISDDEPTTTVLEQVPNNGDLEDSTPIPVVTGKKPQTQSKSKKPTLTSMMKKQATTGKPT